ncbi:hypothetical protein BJX61DRAFT_296785 [Aspergillus egyptiacus]|nr:hypothetical protein BJX61DRAFT_296785 [Aspergillus egyptiacus]
MENVSTQYTVIRYCSKGKTVHHWHQPLLGHANSFLVLPEILLSSGRFSPSSPSFSLAFFFSFLSFIFSENVLANSVLFLYQGNICLKGFSLVETLLPLVYLPFFFTIFGFFLPLFVFALHRARHCPST